MYDEHMEKKKAEDEEAMGDMGEGGDDDYMGDMGGMGGMGDMGDFDMDGMMGDEF